MGILDKLKDIIISPPKWYRAGYIDGYEIEFYRSGARINGTMVFSDGLWCWSICSFSCDASQNYTADGMHGDFETAKEESFAGIDRVLAAVERGRAERKSRFAANEGSDLRYKDKGKK